MSFREKDVIPLDICECLKEKHQGTSGGEKEVPEKGARTGKRDWTVV